MADFRLQIVTKQRTVFDEEVTALTMPGEDGFFGVLAHHAPIISVLKKGPMTIRQGLHERKATIGEGFFEMENNVATLLTEFVEGIAATENEEEE